MMKISFFSRIKKFAVNARKKSKGITLGEFTRSYADERRKEGEKIYEGRCGSVRSMLKHLETSGGSDIPLKKVDVETVKQFIDYLRSAHDLHKNMKTPGKLSDSTIHLKVNILKSVLREAVRQGLLDQNPFDRLPLSYRVKAQYKERTALTQEELIKLSETPCNTPELKEAFLLSCITGLRKSDILSLSIHDIEKRDDTYYIYKKMKKTQRWLRLPLPEEAHHILSKLHAKNGDTPYFFAHLSPHHLGEHLEVWLEDCCISDKHITFHSGRHTCATLLLTQGTDLYTIMRYLGHQNINTTQRYAHITDQQLCIATHQISNQLRNIAC
ncbi:tyrosine-type recombinase/integrase [Segatella copri]|uniref:Site-specific integrase n=1 Tax=Segatella copri TaxID=165179 RepID=A0A6G1VKR9_9BACT|nr:site-specific integrase [Segatella copri]MQN59276.1 site-specific integrase [Segatella copri]MQP13343.1 site-specific integrase [Segatella copri]